VADPNVMLALGRPYTMSISRLTVDKLGVKLYDSVSAVVAELIANCYDADATDVTVRLPLSTLLARKSAGGDSEDAGYVVEVIDDGHGMTPKEAIEFYLQVGRDRRAHVEQGKTSREKKRPVMGRKGIGKLAPFGICRLIEVISAGGPKTDQGFLLTHFTMDYDKILADTDVPVTFDPGPNDRTYASQRGTTIRLKSFLPKRVPDAETFHRQLARRFVFARPDFTITVEDTRAPAENPPKKVDPMKVPLMEGTRVDVSTRPVITEDGETLQVTGWLGLAKEAYKNEEMAGVRIYARGKIVATTRDFEQPAGYTGEFTARSYLVGQIVAEWLDLDDGEDLVRTDRQGIVWDSDYGRALRKWGGELIREIAAKSREPRRQRVRDIFLEKSGIERLAKERFPNNAEVADAVLDLAKQIGSFAAEDELEDQEYVNGLTEVIISVAPHKALIQAFQAFSKTVDAGNASLDDLLELFSKTRVAEMASYSQIAAERVQVLDQLQAIVLSEADEAKLQALLEDAPWLIEPSWSVITQNETLKTFKSLFEDFWKKRTGEELHLSIDSPSKRPDFTLINVGHLLHIVEIKASGHEFNDADCKRLLPYVDAFEEFWKQNPAFDTEFSAGWRIDLVADGVKLKDSALRRSYAALEGEGKVVRVSWKDFLLRARQAHEIFLRVRDGAPVVRSRPTTNKPSPKGAPKLSARRKRAKRGKPKRR
jgi:hypothetical protein